MKTCCPSCQTTFRVTPEQIKVRAGKVRCGQCRNVFNALDCLLEESPATPGAEAAQPAPPEPEAAPATSEQFVPQPTAIEARPETRPAEAERREATMAQTAAGVAETAAETMTEALTEATRAEATREMAMAAGLIMPRDTSDIPGYSKWAEGGIGHALPLPTARHATWPFVLAALLLVLALVVQLAYYFRSEIALSTPSLRPALEMLSAALGSKIPLPQHVELVSIETSDLQADPAHGKLLVLNATLRNRAPYGQAYPLLELSLTDTQDNAIARRVFQPDEYLPAQLPPTQPFAANADIAVRLWIEAGEIGAAGYRLYVFYP